MMVFPLVIAASGAPTPASSQEPPRAEAPQEGVPQGPAPLEPINLLPPLTTIPVRRGAPAFNITSVDASLLPRDNPDIWVLDFAFKPLRIVSAEIPGKGRRQLHYLAYRVVNRTGEPRDFVPQFIMVTDTGKRIEEAVIPKVVKMIQAREDPTINFLGAVDIAGVIPPSTKEGVDDSVYGVAIWDGVDPNADRIKIYVRGLSNGYTVESPDAPPSTVRYKTLRIDLVRRGDNINLNEKEIELAEPPYEWGYWSDQQILQDASRRTARGPAPLRRN